MTTSFVLYFLILLNYVFCASIVENKIPNFIQVCRRTDPKLNECVKFSVEKIKPYLAKGIPELTIPSCDPLHLKNDILIDLYTGPSFTKIAYKNISIIGATDFKLNFVDINLDQNTLKVNLSIPKLETQGILDVRGKISGLPMAGNGPSHGIYSKVEAEAIMFCERIMKEGKKYLYVRDISIKISVDYAKLSLKEVFKGDFGKYMDEFLSKNGKTIAQEVTPILEDTIGNMFKNLSNRIFGKYQIDEILPK